MGFWKIITIACTASIIVTAKHLPHENPSTSTTRSHICDPLFNNTNKIQCFCIKDTKLPDLIRSAECSLSVPGVTFEDKCWNAFKDLAYTYKIILTNTRGIPLNYVPTNAIKHATTVRKLEIKYAVIHTVLPYAFGNNSYVEEMIIRDNQIEALENNAFAHHNDLKTISLDNNIITEINRNVFVDLPKLEKLFLTKNQISTIHDKAFIHLKNLKELEIDRNKIFSLNYATFEGLINLEKLDISGNSLEVIGDNTFSAVGNLKILNLGANKIQMLDEKAFNGLNKLISLSLAHNSLTEIDNDKVFEPLVSLTSLSLRENKIKELKSSAMAPILSNFYSNTSSLDVEENNFPCDCRLDFFMSIMNKTLNKYLKIALENLKCTPDAALKEAWSKTTETEKSNQQIFEENDPQLPGNDYEYYDETQLNGKLFYLDVRDLLHCNQPTKLDEGTTTTTKELTSPTIPPTVNTPISNTPSLIGTTANIEVATEEKMRRESNENHDITTTRLATVSAKPVDVKIYDNMASDQAKPDRIKAHRSIQEELKKPIGNNANRHVSFITMFLVLLVALV